jgi:hypothetical protein
MMENSERTYKFARVLGEDQRDQPPVLLVAVGYPTRKETIRWDENEKCVMKFYSWMVQMIQDVEYRNWI